MGRHINPERFSVSPFPPLVVWEPGSDNFDTPRQGLVTNLNSRWIRLVEPIKIVATSRSGLAHVYRSQGSVVESIKTESGIHIVDERGYDAFGLNLPWALRDWRRTLTLGSSIAGIPNDQLTDFGVKNAEFLRRHVELLVPDPEIMLLQYS